MGVNVTVPGAGVAMMGGHTIGVARWCGLWKGDRSDACPFQPTTKRWHAILSPSLRSLTVLPEEREKKSTNKSLTFAPLKLAESYSSPSPKAAPASGSSLRVSSYPTPHPIRVGIDGSPTTIGIDG